MVPSSTGEGRAIPIVVGGLAALVGLAAGILAKVDPLMCVGRAVVAFVLGMVGTQFWLAVFATAPREALASPTGEVEGIGSEGQDGPENRVD